MLGVGVWGRVPIPSVNHLGRRGRLGRGRRRRPRQRAGMSIFGPIFGIRSWGGTFQINITTFLLLKRSENRKVSTPEQGSEAAVSFSVQRLALGGTSRGLTLLGGGVAPTLENVIPQKQVYHGAWAQRRKLLVEKRVRAMCTCVGMSMGVIAMVEHDM